MKYPALTVSLIAATLIEIGFWTMKGADLPSKLMFQGLLVLLFAVLFALCWTEL